VNKAEIHSVLADYNVSKFDRDPSFSAVLESFDFSQLRSRQISSFLQSGNFHSSFVGFSNFRSVIDCLVDLQRTAKNGSKPRSRMPPLSPLGKASVGR
jgi:hypothetical protein